MFVCIYNDSIGLAAEGKLFRNGKISREDGPSYDELAKVGGHAHVNKKITDEIQSARTLWQTNID